MAKNITSLKLTARPRYQVKCSQIVRGVGRKRRKAGLIDIGHDARSSELTLSEGNVFGGKLVALAGITGFVNAGGA